jgi:hypothetical protein
MLSLQQNKMERKQKKFIMIKTIREYLLKKYANTRKWQREGKLTLTKKKKIINSNRNSKPMRNTWSTMLK